MVDDVRGGSASRGRNTQPTSNSHPSADEAFLYSCRRTKKDERRLRSPRIYPVTSRCSTALLRKGCGCFLPKT